MSQQPWGKAIFGGAGLIVLTITTIWGVLKNQALSCTMFDLTGNWTTIGLVVGAASGWALAFAFFYLPGISVLWKAKLEERVLTEDRVLREAVSAKKLRIFASGSQTLQRALHPHVGRITHNLSIELLVRTDDSPSREIILAEEVARWRRDIRRDNVTLSVRAYSFEPLMFRGIIIDEKVACTGFYYRGSGRTQGQSDKVFRVADRAYVLTICKLFDQMFAAGRSL